MMDIALTLVKIANRRVTKRDLAELVKDDTWRVYDTAIPLDWVRHCDAELNKLGLPKLNTFEYVWVYYEDGRSGPVNVMAEACRKFFDLEILNWEELQELAVGYNMVQEDRRADADCARMKSEDVF